MMDRAKILQRVDPALSTACVDGALRLHHSGPPADPVSKVLDDDNLLIEIMVRLGFPTSLVRATLVCKRWFCLGSQPAFLRRFRKLHPPRILGFYARNMLDHDIIPHFVPMLPQPPELHAVIRRTNFRLDTCNRSRIHVVQLHGGNVFIHLTATCAEAMHNPICPDRGMASFPQLPPCQLQHGGFCTLSDLVLKQEGDSLSYFYVWIESTGQLTNSTAHVYTLQDGSWCMLTSITIADLYFLPRTRMPLLVNNKIYILASVSNILVLDLSTSSFSVIHLPQGVEYHGVGDTIMSRADDESAVYLIHANGFQLAIWLHKREKWSLMDTICLGEMLANLGMSDHTFEDDHTDVVFINQVGNNAEFVFLQIGRIVLYLDIKCRMFRKVYAAVRDGVMHHIHPFFMIWPPTFPALKEDSASEATRR